MSVTLAQIKTQCRERADMVNSLFVTNSELVSYINASIAELHDLLIAAFNEEYYMDEHTFSANGSAISFALPATFYKLRGVDVRQGSGEWATVKRFNFNRRNEAQQGSAYNIIGVPFLEYRIVGSNVRFNRIPDNNLNFRIFFYPKAQTLSADSDTYDDINGFVEYVVVDVAIKMLNKEESDTSVLLAQKAALKARIEGMAQNRDANEPESVTDVYAEDNEFVLYGRGS
jgi:hypothetical protein